MKPLMLILIISITIFSLDAQQDGARDAFPVINEEELPVFNDNTPAEAEAGDEILPSVGFTDLVRVVIVLAAVIAAIYVLLLFLKKVSPMAESGEESIRILSTRHLKRDCSLHLVEVGNQVFLVASGSSSVNGISEIRDKETLDQIQLEKEHTRVPAAGYFRKLLRKGLSKGLSPGTGEKISEQSPEFLKTQRSRLKNLGDRK